MKKWLESVIEKKIIKILPNMLDEHFLSDVEFNILELKEDDLLCWPISITSHENSERISRFLQEKTNHKNVLCIAYQDNKKFYYPFIIKNTYNNWNKTTIKPTHEQQILFAYDDSYGYSYGTGYYDKSDDKYYGNNDTEANPDFWSEIKYLEYKK